MKVYISQFSENVRIARYKVAI